MKLYYEKEVEHIFCVVHQKWKGCNTSKHAFRAAYGFIRDGRKWEIGFTLFLGWKYPTDEDAFYDAVEW